MYWLKYTEVPYTSDPLLEHFITDTYVRRRNFAPPASCAIALVLLLSSTYMSSNSSDLSQTLKNFELLSELYILQMIR